MWKIGTFSKRFEDLNIVSLEVGTLTNVDPEDAFQHSLAYASNGIEFNSMSFNLHAIVLSSIKCTCTLALLDKFIYFSILCQHWLTLAFDGNIYLLWHSRFPMEHLKFLLELSMTTWTYFAFDDNIYILWHLKFPREHLKFPREHSMTTFTYFAFDDSILQLRAIFSIKMFNIEYFSIWWQH